VNFIYKMFSFATHICIHNKLISRPMRCAKSQRTYPENMLLHCSTP